MPAYITADARAAMHVGIANSRRRGKRSRHSQSMRNPQFYVSGKRPIAIWSGAVTGVRNTFHICLRAFYRNPLKILLSLYFDSVIQLCYRFARVITGATLDAWTRVNTSSSMAAARSGGWTSFVWLDNGCLSWLDIPSMLMVEVCIQWYKVILLTNV